MGLLYSDRMKKYYTKKEIIEKTGISDSTYKRHLRKIKEHPKFKDYIELRRVDYPALNKGYQEVLFFRRELLSYYFHLKIKPKIKNDEKKNRSYIISKKVDYTVTITPKMNRKDNISIMRIIENDLKKTYGKYLITFEFNVELDPNSENEKYFHTHLLLGFRQKTDLEEVKSHFTRYIEERVGKSKIIEMNPYYGVGNNAGKLYFLKEGLIGHSQNRN
jgi:hypothetical protein